MSFTLALTPAEQLVVAHATPTDAVVLWQALRDQTIGDGIMHAAILVRYETWLRPEQWRWKDWELGQSDKVRASVAMIEKNVAVLGKRVDIGTITVACSLSYLDFRFSQLLVSPTLACQRLSMCPLRQVRL